MNITYNNKDAGIKATILDDGTLVINMPADTAKIRRVLMLVEGEDSQYGSLFHLDDGNRITRCGTKDIITCEKCRFWSDENMCVRPGLDGDKWHDPKYFETYPDDFCSYGKEKEWNGEDGD